LLVKLRLRSDFEVNAKGITENRVDGFSDEEIADLPESALVHIADAEVYVGHAAWSTTHVALVISVTGKAVPLAISFSTSCFDEPVAKMMHC
jgi:hypothetical protein